MEQLRTIIEQYRHRIFTMCYYYLGQSEDAEDLTQEVLVRLWKHWERVHDNNVEPWLIRVTRNLCIDALRNRHSHRARITKDGFDTAVEKAPDQQPDPRSRLQLSELQEQLKLALTRISEPYRSIVILREIQHLSYTQISEILDMPLNTLKVYLHRGRRMLRDMLRERMHHGEV